MSEPTRPVPGPRTARRSPSAAPASGEDGQGTLPMGSALPEDETAVLPPRPRPRRATRSHDTAIPDERAASRARTGRNLTSAILSGLLLAFLFIGSLVWHPAAFTAFIGLVALLGVVETGRVCRGQGVPVATPVVVLATVVVMLGAYTAGHAGQAVGLLTLFFGAVVWELADVERRDVVRRIAATLLLGLWVPFLGSYAVLLANRPSDGWVAVLATVAIVAFADIGAYGVGSRWGRHKLAPSVSPGKTWEGVVGGLAIATLLAVAVLPLLGQARLFPPQVAFLYALVVGTAGVLGDLAESMFKRDVGVKDFGALIPGHGGVLDRMDAMLFALPVGYLTLVLLQR